jgi:hypothetical protein
VPLAQATVSPCALNAGRARCREPVTATLPKPTASNAADDDDAVDEEVGGAEAEGPVEALDDEGRLRPVVDGGAASPAALPPPPPPTPGVVGGGGDDGLLVLLLLLLLRLLVGGGSTSEASGAAPPLARVDAGGIG